LVLVFGNRYLWRIKKSLQILKEFPYEHIIFCSTAGEIMGSQVNDNSITVTAIEFEKHLVVKTENILERHTNAEQLGEALYNQIPKKDLKHLFVLSEGSFVNGSSLINGLEQGGENKTSITGGMCGDDDRFENSSFL
jgi:hypothetical protein